MDKFKVGATVVCIKQYMTQYFTTGLVFEIGKEYEILGDKFNPDKFVIYFNEYGGIGFNKDTIGEYFEVKQTYTDEHIIDLMNNLFDDQWNEFVENCPEFEDELFLDSFLVKRQGDSLVIYALWEDGVWNSKRLQDYEHLDEVELSNKITLLWDDSIQNTIYHMSTK